MKRIVKKVVSYQCSICKTEYPAIREAKKCEGRFAERKIFRAGDKVKNIEPRACNKNHKQYCFKGTVIKIHGPKPADYEYEAKWLGGKRTNWHVFHYEVKFTCPMCKEERSELYYAPELLRLRENLRTLK